MNVNVQTLGRARPAPTFNLAPNAHVIRSDAEAIEVAQALAAEFAVEAATRDREQRLPAAELDRFSASGLWGITVPKVYGGAGLQQPPIREPFGTRTCRDGTSILISRRAHAYTRCYPIAV